MIPIIGLIFYDWIYYLGHLADHQMHSFVEKYAVQEILNKKCAEKEICQIGDVTFDQNSITRINLILSVKSFGDKIYDLKDSGIYKTFVPLDRDILGWAITVAYPLELKEKKFYFPFIGEYGYLGFFNEDIVKMFEEKFRSKGFDVHRSTTGAYTSLGYFEDPIFSTYLDFSEYRLIQLVLHEMAHLRLYFEDDTNFSESLASFIEEYAAKDYIERVLFTKLVVKNKARLLSEQKMFNKALNDVQTKLRELYVQEMTNEEKYRQKEVIFQDFRETLKKLDAQNHYISTRHLLRLEEINNATLLQTSRYNPSKDSGFQTLFLEQCKKDYDCWFKELNRLRPCSLKQRQMFVSEERSLEYLVNICKK